MMQLYNVGATKGSFHFVTQSTESCPQKSRHCSYNCTASFFFVQLLQECFMSDILTHTLQCSWERYLPEIVPFNWSLHLQALFVASTSPHCVYLANLVYSTVLPSLMCLLTLRSSQLFLLAELWDTALAIKVCRTLSQGIVLAAVTQKSSL